MRSNLPQTAIEFEESSISHTLKLAQTVVVLCPPAWKLRAYPSGSHKLIRVQVLHLGQRSIGAEQEPWGAFMLTMGLFTSSPSWHAQ
jgi:hypothetical protein